MSIKRAFLVCVALAVVLMAVSTACRDRESPGGALRGVTWQLVSLDGNSPIQGPEATLRFEEETFQGYTGCNNYGGSYTASGSSLSLSGVFATERACLEPAGLMEQEGAYLDALRSAATYQVGDDGLEMYDDTGGDLLSFVAQEASE